MGNTLKTILIEANRILDYKLIIDNHGHGKYTMSKNDISIEYRHKKHLISDILVEIHAQGARRNQKKLKQALGIEYNAL